MTRPLARPPTPRAMSKPRDPVDTTWISWAISASPSRMIEPLPNCFSICARAAVKAFCLSPLKPENSEFAELWVLGF